MFDMNLSYTPVKPQFQTYCSRSITPSTVIGFAEAFRFSIEIFDCLPPSVDTNELFLLFDSVCSDILDHIAPCKVRNRKVKTLLWVNDMIRSLRRECRRAERKWKINCRFLILC